MYYCPVVANEPGDRKQKNHAQKPDFSIFFCTYKIHLDLARSQDLPRSIRRCEAFLSSSLALSVFSLSPHCPVCPSLFCVSSPCLLSQKDGSLLLSMAMWSFTHHQSRASRPRTNFYISRKGSACCLLSFVGCVFKSNRVNESPPLRSTRRQITTSAEKLMQKAFT